MSKAARKWAEFTAEAVNLSVSERAVLMVLAREHSRHGGCVISVERIAALTGLSVRSVQYKLRNLEDARLIARSSVVAVDGRQRPNRIEFLWPIERRTEELVDQEVGDVS